MNTSRLARRVAAVALLFGVAAGTTACDVADLLEVTDRDRVPPQTLEDPAQVQIAINSAIGNFQEAYAGTGGESFISVVGLMSDELYSSGTFTTRTATDRRSQFSPANGNTSDDAYEELQFARRALVDAARNVANHEDFGPNSDDLAELKALEGYTLVALGEAFCAAVPLSTGNVTNPGQSESGQPLTSRQVLSEAVSRFDTSLGATSNHLAAVGKGRALLSQGEVAQAANAVASVPMDFVYHIIHSESGGQNGIFGLQGNGRYSLSDGEGTGGNTIDFVAAGAQYTRGGGSLEMAGDDRTPWWGPTGGFDASIPQFHTLLYNNVEDNTPLASGVEAWLIKAEAQAQSNPAGATALLNELRANADALMQGLHDWSVRPENELAPLPAAGSTAQALEQVFEERAFWLLLTGHRLGDLRRLMWQYGINNYPTGAYHKSGSYGNDVVFPLDFDEENNEFFDGSMCNVESASID